MRQTDARLKSVQGYGEHRREASSRTGAEQGQAPRGEGGSCGPRRGHEVEERKLYTRHGRTIFEAKTFSEHGRQRNG